MIVAAYSMPPSLLAALRADVLAGGWTMTSAYPTHETVTLPNPVPGLPPVTQTTRRVMASLFSAARGLSLSVTLEGPDGQPPERLTVGYAGTPWVTGDAALILRIDAAVAALMAHREAELLVKLAPGP